MSTDGLLEQWDEVGFFTIRRFATAAVCREMLDRAIQVSRSAQGELLHGGKIVLQEANISGDPALSRPEQQVSKIFRLHREQPFRSWVTRPEIVSLATRLLGTEADCFLSQFIFKNPGAWGQPWHQDSFYFPFDRGPQVGLWLAITDATIDNGCLHVLPGSHREPVLEHVPDLRPGANYGYFEIIGRDTSDALPVLMKAGDLLVFHSHLMHRSTDNESSEIRAAMVYHLGQRGTVDLSAEPSPVNDWMALSSPTGQLV